MAEFPSPYFDAYAGTGTGGGGSTGSSPYGGYGGAPDFRYRENGYAGNGAFAAPGGVRTGNGFIDTVGNLAMQSFFPGQEFRPFQGTDLPDYDYLQARGRQNQFMQAYGPLLASQRGVFPAGSDLAANPVAQMAQEQLGLTYGGSNVQAFQVAYGRMGHLFGDSPEQGRRDSMRLMEEVNDRFTGADGRYDYDKSFGFNRRETVENVDSALRFGFGGMSRARFAADVREGRAGDYAARVNETTRLGQQVLGPGASADQINDLLDKAMGGLADVSPEKAQEFLAKVQATARAVDVNSKAFAEYLALQKRTLESMGIQGGVSSSLLMGSALHARGASDRGRQDGDAILSDQNRAQDALNQNAAASERSTFMKELRFAAAGALDQDDTEGQGQLRQVNALIKAGRGDEAETLFNRYKATHGADNIAEGGRHLSEEDATASQKLVDASPGADVDADVRRHGLELTYERARQSPGFDGTVSKEAYERATAGLGARGLESSRQVEDALTRAGIAPDQARTAARALSEAARVDLNNTVNFAPFGRNNQAQVRASFDQSREGVARSNAAADESRDTQANRERNLNAVMGDATRPVNVPELAGLAGGQILDEFQKTGTLSKESLQAAMKTVGQSLTQTDKLTQVARDFEGGRMDQPGYRLNADANAPVPASGTDGPAPTDRRGGSGADPQELAPRGTKPPAAAEGETADTAKESLNVQRKSGTALEAIIEQLKAIAANTAAGPAPAPSSAGLR